MSLIASADRAAGDQRWGPGGRKVTSSAQRA